MSFKSILKVAGKNYNVLSINYGLFRKQMLREDHRLLQEAGK